MNVQMDIIIPPIILGVLILMIFAINAFILESSVDNRLQNEMQIHANMAVDVIQEEIRGLEVLLEEPDNSVVFRTFRGDSVAIERMDSDLRVIRRYGHMATTVIDTTVHALYLKDLQFSPQPAGVNWSLAHFITVSVRTESRSDDHVSFNEDQKVVGALSEKQIFFRNKVASVP